MYKEITTKQHYKMYKRGKFWVTAGITATFTLINVGGEMSARADTTVESSPETNVHSQASVQHDRQVSLRESTSSQSQASANPASSVSDNQAKQVATEASAASQPTESAVSSTVTEASSATSATSATSEMSASSTTTSQAVNTDQKQAQSVESTVNLVKSQVAKTDVSQGQTVESTTSSKNTSTAQASVTNSAVSKAVSNNESDAKTVQQASATSLESQTTAAVNPAVLKSNRARNLDLLADESIDQWMPNKLLQQAVLKELNRPGTGKKWASASEITQDDMLLLKSLNMQEYKTYLGEDQSFSLEGLQYATNMVSLDLVHVLTYDRAFFGSVTDLTPLKSLVNLTTLSLASNRISDISPIVGLPKVTSLNLSNNSIADLSGLNPKQYTTYFNITRQFIENPAVRIPTTGQYSMANPIKLPVGMSLTELPSATISRGILDADVNNLATIRAFINAGTSTVNGSNLDYQVQYSQIMPGNVKATGYNVVQNPYTYYMISTFTDNIRPGVASTWVVTPYTVAENAQPVTVNYVDEQNNQLADPVVIPGLVGDSYQTEEKSFTGYELVQKPSNATGTFSAVAQTVSYVYRTTSAVVNVHYQDESAQTIQADKQVTGVVGADFAIDYPSIEGYTYVKTIGTAAGKFTSTPGDVTFVYKKAMSQVTVQYHDEDGNVIKTDLVSPGQVGTDYSFDHPEIAGYTYLKTTGTAAGKYTSDASVVTFVYQKAMSQVTVQYHDEDGNVIKTDLVSPGQVGTDYSFDHPEITGYTYLKTTGTATGKYSSNASVVTFVYQKAMSQVTVRYHDEDGNVIKADLVSPGQVGTDYNFDHPDITGYTYLKTTGTASGKYTSDASVVTFIYQKAMSQVTVQYHDEDGNVIKTDLVSPGQVGTDYSFDHPEITGYTYLKTTGTAAGKYTSDASVVTFIYQKTMSQVTVQYHDEDGNVIKTDLVSPGQVGTDYSFDHPEITGYTYLKTTGTATGKYTSDASVVTFIYQKAMSQITVQYQDEAGNRIQTSQVSKGQVGSEYHFDHPAITGYTYLKASGNLAGQYTNAPQVITFIYQKAMSQITVQYQDVAGKTIQPSVVSSGQVGTDFNFNHPEISGYTYLRTIGEPACQYTSNPATVTFVYKQAMSQVTLQYQDEAGSSIKPTAVSAGQVGTSFTFNHPEISGYTYVKTTGSATGKYTSNPTVVTFIYQKAMSQVTVQYQDAVGNDLQDKLVSPGQVGTEFSFDRPIIVGYTFVSVIGNAAGKYSRVPQVVTFIYQKAMSQVTVQYQNESGNTLQKSLVISGQVGTDFKADYPAIDGYTYVRTIGNATGKFGSTGQVVTFVYQRVMSQVSVHYQDEAGQTLQQALVATGQVGTNFSFEHPTIAGYTYLKTLGQATGMYTNVPTAVTFIYQKATSQVTVQYHDEAGKVLRPDSVSNGQIGTDFSFNYPTITGYTYVRTVGNATGQYSSEPVTVTFIYHQQAEPTVPEVPGNEEQIDPVTPDGPGPTVELTENEPDVLEPVLTPIEPVGEQRKPEQQLQPRIVQRNKKQVNQQQPRHLTAVKTPTRFKQALSKQPVSTNHPATSSQPQLPQTSEQANGALQVLATMTTLMSLGVAWMLRKRN